MKILLIENKFKTITWQEIARLLGDGVDVHWLIQNPIFQPVLGKCHFIPLPSDKEKPSIINDLEFSEIKLKDRYFSVYHNEPTHYPHYAKYISTILDRLMPDVVIGEATLFHELITIERCKQLGILYLNPSSCRYPSGRFSFYKYDTQEPYLGSDEVWQDKEIDNQIDSISRRSVKPDYMILKTNKVKKIFNTIKKSNFNIRSLAIGERFNTPSLMEKYKKNEETKRAKNNFLSIAQYNIDSFDSESCVVYPMQMQPEANLDVWGYPFNDQASTIRKLSDNIGDKFLLIKPNPKWKYEISQAFLDVIFTKPNVFALSPDISMESIFNKFEFFYTVTGTVAHEALLSDKLCLSNRSAILRKFKPDWCCPPEAVNFEKATKSTNQQKHALMSYLIKSSYRGIINDPITDPSVLNSSNLRKLKYAFTDMLESLKS